MSAILIWRNTAALPAAFLAIVLAAGTSNADFIQPAGVASSSFFDYQMHPTNIINGSGLSAESAAATHTASGTAVHQWHAGVGYASGGGAPVVDNQYHIFTLPGTFDLTDMYVWQANQTSALTRGVNQFDMDVSSDGVNWSPVLVNDTLAISPGGNISAQTKSFAASNVKFARFGIDTAHSGSANDYVGLSEVRFEGTQLESGPKVSTQYATTGPGLATPPSSNDLLQGVVATSNKSIIAGSTSLLTDGVGSNDFAHRVIGADSAANWVLTYDLNLPTGWWANVNEINVYSYNTDGRRIVDFDVEYSNDGVNWEYAFIGASNIPLGSGLVTLTSLARDDNGFFIEDARQLRFTFRPVVASVQSSSLIEIDVFGVIIPEPNTYLLGLYGSLALAALLWRRGTL